MEIRTGTNTLCVFRQTRNSDFETAFLNLGLSAEGSVCYTSLSTKGRRSQVAHLTSIRFGPFPQGPQSGSWLPQPCLDRKKC